MMAPDEMVPRLIGQWPGVVTPTEVARRTLARCVGAKAYPAQQILGGPILLLGRTPAPRQVTERACHLLHNAFRHNSIDVPRRA